MGFRVWVVLSVVAPFRSTEARACLEQAYTVSRQNKTATEKISHFSYGYDYAHEWLLHSLPGCFGSFPYSS